MIRPPGPRRRDAFAIPRRPTNSKSHRGPPVYCHSPAARPRRRRGTIPKDIHRTVTINYTYIYKSTRSFVRFFTISHSFSLYLSHSLSPDQPWLRGKRWKIFIKRQNGFESRFTSKRSAKILLFAFLINKIITSFICDVYVYATTMWVFVQGPRPPAGFNYTRNFNQSLN